MKGLLPQRGPKFRLGKRTRLLLCGLGMLVWQPAQGQETVPPAGAQAATPTLTDRFAQELETLSKRFGVAIVAEGEPFPQPAARPQPALNPAFGPDQTIKEFAEFFDYDVLHEGNTYILTKRYTDPADIPDVTPEECRNGLKLAAKAFPGGSFSSNFANSPDDALIKMLTMHSVGYPSEAQWTRMGQNGIPISELSNFVKHTAWLATCKFYYQPFQDRIAGTFAEMDDRPPTNPLFHWKTIDNTPVFGYDTLAIDFIPLSDADRVVVPTNTLPLPRPGFHLREDVALPANDRTLPTLLSEATKLFLNQAGKSPAVVSLSQAVAALNKRGADANRYDLDAMYADKHVMMAGTDRLPPEAVMHALAAAYSLQIRYSNGKVILAAPDPAYATDATQVKDTLIKVIPAPIYCAFRLRTVPIVDPATGAVNTPSPTLADYERQGIALHNTLLQMFRYLAESQIPSRNGTPRTLSRLGARANSLFMLARMARAYTDLCGVADCPPPPYLVDIAPFMEHATLYGRRTGTVYHPGVQLSLTYPDPKTGMPYGPVEFLNSNSPSANP